MFVNLVGMVGVAIYAYSTGSTQNIYRATDNNGNICGGTNSSAVNYPYSYFYNPKSLDLSNRICVSSCPSYNNNTLSTLNCFTNPSVSSCAYTMTILQDGSASKTITDSDFIGYDSVAVIGRVCIPTSNVISNAFSSFSNTMSDGLRQAGIANFVTDLQNVFIL
jgi:hypothetical protein